MIGELFAGNAAYHPKDADGPTDDKESRREDERHACSSNAVRERSRHNRGQGTVEWVLLVALLVVAVFAMIFFFRHFIIELATEAWLKIQEFTQ
jgi:cation transport regulator ChaB